MATLKFWNSGSGEWEYVPSGGNASYSGIVPSGSTTVMVNHNLGTTAVIPQCFRASDGEEVFPTINVTDANTVTLKFSSAPTAGQYRVVVVSAVPNQSPVGQPITYVRAENGSTSLPPSSTVALAGYTDFQGETSWVTPVDGGITVPEDGWYLLNGGFRFDNTIPSGTRIISYLIADGNFIAGSRIEFEATTSTPSMNPTTLVWLSAGTKVQIVAWQGSTGTHSASLQVLTVTRFSTENVVLDTRYARRPSDWIVPTLEAGWTAETAGDVAYRIEDGVLRVKGTVVAGAGVSNNIFIVPEPYRPSAMRKTVAYGADSTEWGPIRLLLSTAGEFHISTLSIVDPHQDASGHIELDGVTFALD